VNFRIYNMDNMNSPINNDDGVGPEKNFLEIACNQITSLAKSVEAMVSKVEAVVVSVPQVLKDAIQVNEKPREPKSKS